MGSSPLTRGKRHSQRDRLPTDRLIPAHAGKTGAGAGYFSERAAHPRSRGENWFVRHPGCVASGSSPLTRGKQRTTPAPITVDGLIPAHAGKTRRSRSARAARPAHPRSRGENATASAVFASVRGSSPLTRGKPPQLLADESHLRLIPAHAGKTRRAMKRAQRLRAHPRSRGENVLGELERERLRGSSPLTRGKHVASGGRVTQIGLIPAHAGKTSRPRSGPHPTRAHPRSRGENSLPRERC